MLYIYRFKSDRKFRKAKNKPTNVVNRDDFFKNARTDMSPLIPDVEKALDAKSLLDTNPDNERIENNQSNVHVKQDIKSMRNHFLKQNHTKENQHQL